MDTIPTPTVNQSIQTIPASIVYPAAPTVTLAPTSTSRGTQLQEEEEEVQKEVQEEEEVDGGWSDISSQWSSQWGEGNEEGG